MEASLTCGCASNAHALCRCCPLWTQSPVHLHVKTIANMAFTTRVDHSHYPLYAPGYHAVTANGTRVDGAFTAHVDYSRVALNHYYTKSYQASAWGACAARAG